MDTHVENVLEYDKIRLMLGQFAASMLGKEVIARMRPGHEEAIIRIRMAETTEARLQAMEVGEPSFAGLHDVREAVTRAEKHAVLTAQELLDVAETAACCRRVHRHLLEAGAGYARLYEQGKLCGEYPRVERAVDHAISSAGEVLDVASVELERARRRVRALHDEIQRELQRIVGSGNVLEQLQEPIITQRNGRFCVPVRAESRHAFKGIVHDISASGQTAFMEPLSVVTLGNDLREAQRREEEEVQRVLAEISALVGSLAPSLLASIDTATRLDVIFARAGFARALHATEPELNRAGIIDVRQARHPLLGDKAIPIDLQLGVDEISTLLITGPNTGGKTVTLKTIGLFTLMAQSGMHVPADAGTRLAIFDAIFVDIGDEQSIEQSLSTFSGHMKRIVGIVHEAGARALVLLDEIGAGTDPTEGAGLAKAILLELHARGCRTIATTHYGELKIFGQNTAGFRNASVEFDLESLRPTYRVITGLPGSSNALAIAQRLGLPKSLAVRAKELMGEAPLAMEQVLKQAEGVRRALDRERTATSKAKREAEESATSLRAAQQEFNEKREAALARAREKAQQILQKARLEANALVDELQALKRELQARQLPAADVSIAALRKRARTVVGTLEDELATLPPPPSAPRTQPAKPSLTEVAAGQAVFVRQIGHNGIALTSGKGDEEVEVQVGIMRVRAQVSDLETGSTRTGTAPPPCVSYAPQLSRELHLLGKRAEEASSELEPYLFDAMEEGLSSVRIVHGFGTGVLKQVVLDVLRRHPAVRTYRPGEPGEGGGGVTIVELRK